MDSVKYVGLDVHRDTISAAVLSGRPAGHAIYPGHAGGRGSGFSAGVRGTVQVTFEEGTHSAWLYDLFRGGWRGGGMQSTQERADEVGQQERSIDARKLAELLRAGMLSPVYHGENSTMRCSIWGGVTPC